MVVTYQYGKCETKYVSDKRSTKTGSQSHLWLPLQGYHTVCYPICYRVTNGQYSEAKNSCMFDKENELLACFCSIIGSSPVLIPTSKPRACNTSTTSFAMKLSHAMDITKAAIMRTTCIAQ